MSYIQTTDPTQEEESTGNVQAPTPGSTAINAPSTGAAGDTPDVTGGVAPTSTNGEVPAANSVQSPSQQSGGIEPTSNSQIANSASSSSSAQPYLDSKANQNAITNYSTQAIQPVAKETQGANDLTNQGTTNLTNAVTAGTPQFDPNATKNVIANPTTDTGADLTQVQKQLSGTYSGPKSSDSFFTDATGAANKAATTAAPLETGNISGPQEFFSQSGVKGQGNQLLDAASFNATPGARKAVQPIADAATAAPANVSGAISQGNQTTIPGGQVNANAVQAQTKTALEGGVTAGEALGSTASQNNIAAYNNLAAEAKDLLNNPVAITGTPTKAQADALSALGFTADQWNKIVADIGQLSALQYVTNLAKQSGFTISQDPITGDFINNATGQKLVIPPNLPLPAGINLASGLSLGDPASLFNATNSNDPKVIANIAALDKLLGVTNTDAATGQTGTQFGYTTPDFTTNITAAQQGLVNQNNANQALIQQALANPNAALYSNNIKQTSLGVAYAVGGANLAFQVAKSVLSGVDSATALATALDNIGYKAATALGASSTAAESVGSATGAIGAALAYVGAAYGVYSFIANWKPGDSAQDALNGAEAGASVGSLFGPIGTVVGAVIGAVVGALSGLIGYKPDPESQYFSSYQSQAAKLVAAEPGVTVNPQSTGYILPLPTSYVPSDQLQDFANSDPAPATTLEGLMDLHGVKGVPIYDHYGRMGGGNFVVDMTKQINQAETSGAISYYSTPQQLYSKVIAPWIAKMGPWTNPNAPSVIALIISMIGQYQSGNISKWTWINGTNYLANQVKPYSQFAQAPTYASSNFAPIGALPGATTANPIGVNDPSTQQAGP